MGTFKLTRTEDGMQHLTVVLDSGTVLGFDSNHPRFDEAKYKVIENDDYDVEDLLSPAKKIVQEFAKLSTELSIRSGKLFLEGEELNNVLADKIVNLYDAEEDYQPFVAFMEKLATNPNGHSVENAYRWLASSDFVIADDGDVIAYKGLNVDGTSIHSGPVIYNGVPFHGHVPNVPGDLIEMDRADVQFDPAVGCSNGLHAGTWEYASGFGSKVVKVKINPKYIVSVPTDCSDQKMRVCRYEVISEVNGPVGAEYDRGYVVASLPDDFYEDRYDEDLDDEDYDDHEFHVHHASNDSTRKFSNGTEVVVKDNPRSSDGDHIGDIIAAGSVGVVVDFDGKDYYVEFVPENSDYEYDVAIAPDSLELKPKPSVDDPSQFKMQKSFPGMNGIPVYFSGGQVTGSVKLEGNLGLGSSPVDTRLNHTRQKRDARGRFLKKGS